MRRSGPYRLPTRVRIPQARSRSSNSLSSLLERYGYASLSRCRLSAKYISNRFGKQIQQIPAAPTHGWHFENMFPHADSAGSCARRTTSLDARGVSRRAGADRKGQPAASCANLLRRKRGAQPDERQSSPKSNVRARDKPEFGIRAWIEIGSVTAASSAWQA